MAATSMNIGMPVTFIRGDDLGNSSYDNFVQNLRAPLAGITSMIFDRSHTLGGFAFDNVCGVSLLSISFPYLQEVDPTGANNALFSFNCSPLDGLSNLTSISIPMLTTVGATLNLGTLYNLPTFSAPVLTTVKGINVSDNVVMTSFSAPLLKVAGGVIFNANAVLTSINLPALTTIDAVPGMNGGASGFFKQLNVDSCGVTSLSLPLLVTIALTTSVTNNPALTTVSMPVWVPTNTRIVNFSNNALNAASVNAILARLVANAAYVSGTVNLTGGTNAAPTGQGVTDKATLLGRGVTLTTN